MKIIINGIEKKVENLPNTEGVRNLQEVPTKEDILQIVNLTLTIAEAFKILIQSIKQAFKK